MEDLRIALAQYYLQIKFVHLLMVGLWSFSTVVAYINYVVPAFKAWQRDPQNPKLIARRNDFMERFDRGVTVEHVAFPLLLASGLLMVWIAGWSLTQVSWLTIKLGIVVVIVVPMELVDYYISHFDGNKARIRATGNTQRYEAMMRFHWLFFRVTTPLIVVFVPLLFYLAVTKPL